MKLNEYMAQRAGADAVRADAVNALAALGVSTAEEAHSVRMAVETAIPHLADDDDRLRVRQFYPPWAAGEHTKGDIYSTGDQQVWECIQTYDNAVYPDIAPGNTAWRTFHRPLHGKTPETAMPWAAPTGAHDMYKAGEYMTMDGSTWRCKQDTAYSPTEYPAAWDKMEAL